MRGYGRTALTPCSPVRLGLDIDGTITLDPHFFARIAEGIKQSGGDVHIVTSRSEISRRATLDELNGYRIQFDAIHFLPELSWAQDECPHKSLDWFQRYLWQKVAYAIGNRLTHFVDDDPKVLSLFAVYAPEIIVMSAMDRVAIADPLYEQAVQVVLARQRASIALVQRNLRLGYTRAVKLIEAMEVVGIVSQSGQDGFREINGKYQRLQKQEYED